MTDLDVLRGAGMTPGQATLAAVAGPAAAGAAGTVLGVAGAVLASRWFPIGNAASIEPAPGIDVDGAFSLLRAYARQTARRIDAVAHDVVERTLAPEALLAAAPPTARPR